MVAPTRDEVHMKTRRQGDWETKEKNEVKKV
jgi:hypothetical protein